MRYLWLLKFVLMAEEESRLSKACEFLSNQLTASFMVVFLDVALIKAI
ncbi:TPA: hypothetical protein ACGSK1_003222 [Escherichia coli]